MLSSMAPLRPPTQTVYIPPVHTSWRSIRPSLAKNNQTRILHPTEKMSQRNVTDTRHNDFVGGDASIGRIPGAENATSGHHFVSVFPKGTSKSAIAQCKVVELMISFAEGPEAQNPSHGVNRPDEKLPAPTGRDRPPRGIGEPIAPAGMSHPTLITRLSRAHLLSSRTRLFHRTPYHNSQSRARPWPQLSTTPAATFVACPRFSDCRRHRPVC